MHLLFCVYLGLWAAGVLLCMWRLCAGPGDPDRAAAAAILGMLPALLFVLMATGRFRELHLYVALAWPVFNLLAAVAVARSLERGRADD